MRNPAFILHKWIWERGLCELSERYMAYNISWSDLPWPERLMRPPCIWMSAVYRQTNAKKTIRHNQVILMSSAKTLVRDVARCRLIVHRNGGELWRFKNWWSIIFRCFALFFHFLFICNIDFFLRIKHVRTTEILDSCWGSHFCSS